jgi:hypothetical protein
MAGMRARDPLSSSIEVGNKLFTFAKETANAAKFIELFYQLKNINV